jgi:hypothetical protein
MRDTPKQPGANRDPITGAPGAHPVGTGVGAAAGGATGAAIGTAVAGPAGTVVGAAAGAIAGGLAGKGVAEMVDPTVEDTYWRDAYSKEPYYAKKRDYDFYAPAYRTGYEGRVKYHGRGFDDVEDDLRKDYVRNNGRVDSWDEVRDATRAAWDRIDRRVMDATRN